jgi:hypothetical protein
VSSRTEGRAAAAGLLLLALALVAGATAATVWQTKAVFAVLGAVGLIALFLVPRRLVTPISISVVLVLAYAVAAPGAPLTGWLVTSGVAVLLTAVSLGRGTAVPARHWAVAALLALFYASLGVATLLGTPENLARWLFAALVPLCIAVMATRLAADGVRLVALVLVVLSIGEALLALGELTVLHGPVWGYPVTDAGAPVVQLNPLLGSRVPRAQGSVGHPVVLGFVLAIGFVLTWVDLARIRAVLRWPALAVIAGGLALSGTRSALAAAAVGVLLVLFTGRDVGRKVRAVFVVAFGGATALVLAASIRAAAAQVQTTGSYTHRVGALDGVLGLMGRPFVEAAIGSGMGSERSLFLRGLLQTDGFYAIDNELVTVLATAGVIGLVLFVAACAVAVRRSTPRLRGVLVTVFVMFFSFDVTSWSLGTTLLALVLTLALRRSAAPALPDARVAAPVAAVPQREALRV